MHFIITMMLAQSYFLLDIEMPVKRWFLSQLKYTFNQTNHKNCAFFIIIIFLRSPLIVSCKLSTHGLESEQRQQQAFALQQEQTCWISVILITYQEKKTVITIKLICNQDWLINWD